MPFYPITDNRTRETFNMPWDDVTTKPSRQDIEQFIFKQKNKSFTSKVGDALTTPLAKIGTATVGAAAQPFVRYGQGEPLSFFGREVAPGMKQGDQYGMGRQLANIGGTYGEAFGEGLDELTSPMGLATTAAGPLGKGLQATGLPYLRGAGSALRTIPRIAGAGMAAHGATSLYNEGELQHPSTWLGPLSEIAIGGLGMRAEPPVTRPKPRTPPSSSIVTSEGLVPPPRMGGGPPIARGVNTSQVGSMRPSTVNVRPTADELLALSTAQPESRFTYVRDSDGLIPQPDFSGVERTPINRRPSMQSFQTPNMTPASEPDYIRRIKQTFDEAVPGARPRNTPPDSPAIPWPKIGESTTYSPEYAARVKGQSPNRLALPPAPETPQPKLLGSGPRVLRSGKVADLADIPEGEALPLRPSKKSYPTADESYTKRKGPPKAVGYPTLTTQETEQLKAGKLSGAERYFSKSFLEQLRRLATESKGEVDVNELMDNLSKAAAKGKGKIGAIREKMLQNIADAEDHNSARAKLKEGLAAITGKDITSASLRGITRSGWAELESMGEPGRKLSRLMKKARTDSNIWLAGEQKAGRIPSTADREAVNRTGGVIWDQHKDDIKALLEQIPEGDARVKAKNIIDKQLGRAPISKTGYEKGVESLKAIQALTKLSQFAIGNTSAAATTFMRGNLGATAKAAMRTLTDYKSALNEAKSSGGLLDKIVGNFGKDLGEGKLSELLDKTYKISGSENRMRTMATLAGKSTAEELFEQLKANPNNKRALKRLDDLILEDDMASVLKQGKLTEHQLKRAGGRMSELTQGIAESIDLPQMWTGHPSMDLITQFKKYSYMQSRNMAEAFKADPKRTAAVFATLFPLMGEAVGDVKAGIKGAVKGATDENVDIPEGIREAIESRGEGKSRYIQNLSQAWAFGMMGDVLEAAQRGPSGLAKELVGPTFGDIGEAGYGAFQLARKGQGYHLGRQAARMVPFIGTGLAGTIKGSYAGRQRRRARTKNKRNN